MTELSYFCCCFIFQPPKEKDYDDQNVGDSN
jgi:hypothetical protein